MKLSLLPIWSVQVVALLLWRAVMRGYGGIESLPVSRFEEAAK